MSWSSFTDRPLEAAPSPYSRPPDHTPWQTLSLTGMPMNNAAPLADFPPLATSPLPSRERQPEIWRSHAGSRRPPTATGSRVRSHSSVSLVRRSLVLHPQWTSIAAKDGSVARQPGARAEPIKTTTRFQALFQKAKDNLDSPDSPWEQEVAVVPGTLKGPPPSLMLYDVEDHSELVSLVKSAAKDDGFTLTFGKDFDHLRLKTMEDYVRVSQLLFCRGIQMSTWATKEERTRTYTVKGFPMSLGENVLQEELESLGFPVRAVFVRKSSDEEEPPSSFAVTIWMSGNWREEDLVGIRRIMNSRVTIRPYTHRFPAMCTNCFRYGHSSYYCVANQRCYKCGMEHDGNECGIGPESRDRFCSNCGGCHYAIDRACPVHRRHAEKKDPGAQLPPAPVRPPGGGGRARALEAAPPPRAEGGGSRQRSYRDVAWSRETPPPPLDEANFPRLDPRGRRGAAGGGPREVSDVLWALDREEPAEAVVPVLDSLISSASSLYSIVVNLRKACLRRRRSAIEVSRDAPF